MSSSEAVADRDARIACVGRASLLDDDDIAAFADPAGTPPVVDDAALAYAARIGVLAVSPDGGYGLSPWVASYLDGVDELSDKVFSLTCPVPALDGPPAVAIADALCSRSPLVEVVAPAGSLAAAHAAGALSRLGLRTLLLNLAGVPEDEILDAALPAAYLQGRCLGYGLVVTGLDETTLAGRAVYGALRASAWPTVLLIGHRTRDFTPRAPFATLTLGHDDPATRLEAWGQLLDEEVATSARTLGLIALDSLEMFEVHARALAPSAAGADDTFEERLTQHARTLLIERSSRLAEFRTPNRSLDQLSLPLTVRDPLESLVASVRAMGRQDAQTRQGIRAIFSGPSGTGKTVSAEAVADALGVPLLVVEISRIVDKYIGETEKNLDRLFSDAERVDALLLFDEGEMLFGSRTNDSGSGTSAFHNLQTSYLLARIEQHRGPVVLTTNFPGVIDSAYLRRFHFAVRFPMPDESTRAEIWTNALARHGLLDGVDVDALSGYDLSGGNIANIALLAALRSGDGRPPSQVLLDKLICSEYEKMARLVPTQGTTIRSWPDASRSNAPGDSTPAGRLLADDRVPTQFAETPRRRQQRNES